MIRWGVDIDDAAMCEHAGRVLAEAAREHPTEVRAAIERAEAAIRATRPVVDRVLNPKTEERS